MKKSMLALFILAVMLAACSTTEPVEQMDQRLILTSRAETRAAASPTPQPQEVRFICTECINNDGTILPITLWSEADDIGLGAGYALHGDTCLLLTTKQIDGIKKAKINCPNGTGWTRFSALQIIN